MSAADRARRAAWESSVRRDPLSADEQDEDDLYWLRVPVDQRAALVWDLSRELYILASRNGGVFDEATGTFVKVDEADLERRLPPAALVLTRR
jgi:hypothetical protein